jgi:hypothetical protein
VSRVEKVARTSSGWRDSNPPHKSSKEFGLSSIANDYIGTPARLQNPIVGYNYEDFSDLEFLLSLSYAHYPDP